MSTPADNDGSTQPPAFNTLPALEITDPKLPSIKPPQSTTPPPNLQLPPVSAIPPPLAAPTTDKTTEVGITALPPPPSTAPAAPPTIPEVPVINHEAKAIDTRFNQKDALQINDEAQLEQLKAKLAEIKNSITTMKADMNSKYELWTTKDLPLEKRVEDENYLEYQLAAVRLKKKVKEKITVTSQIDSLKTIVANRAIELLNLLKEKQELAEAATPLGEAKAKLVAAETRLQSFFGTSADEIIKYNNVRKTLKPPKEGKIKSFMNRKKIDRDLLEAIEGVRKAQEAVKKLESSQ